MHAPGMYPRGHEPTGDGVSTVRVRSQSSNTVPILSENGTNTQYQYLARPDSIFAESLSRCAAVTWRRWN
eukprot:581234-Prymnesium_polylepis.1